jgi:tetrahydromethanopterin S-methyltransferase subunit G
MKDLVEAKSAPRPAEPSGAQKARSTRGKDVWQRKGLEEEQSPFAKRALGKEVEVESREEQRLRTRPSEDELPYTRRRVAEITRRVNYFVGTVRISCGKSIGRRSRMIRGKSKPPGARRRPVYPATRGLLGADESPLCSRIHKVVKSSP